MGWDGMERPGQRLRAAAYRRPKGGTSQDSKGKKTWGPTFLHDSGITISWGFQLDYQITLGARSAKRLGLNRLARAL